MTLVGATNVSKSQPRGSSDSSSVRRGESWKLPRPRGGKPLRAGAAARRALRQLRAAAREAFLTEDYPVCTANVEKAGQLHRGPGQRKRWDTGEQGLWKPAPTCALM